jgi:16S rRNA (uracil1498-N3)-methyltransferase
VGEVTLEPEESAHLVRVRRVGQDEPVVLFDGRGATRRARLLDADPRRTRLVIEGDAPDREPARALVIAASIPEPARADELLEGLAWLGVTRWVPLVAARTPPGRAELVERRRERWVRVAREAAKGNGRSRLLEVAPATELRALLEVAPTEGLVLCDPDPAAPSLLDLLPRTGTRPWLVVGPEGGFTAAELQAAFTAGARVASLGATALRVEQAAWAAASQALGRA